MIKYKNKTQIFPEIKVVNSQEKNQIFPEIKVVNVRERVLISSKSIYHFLILFKTPRTPCLSNLQVFYPVGKGTDG